MDGKDGKDGAVGPVGPPGIIGHQGPRGWFTATFDESNNLTFIQQD